MTTMQGMVAGFAIDEDLDNVLLIRKNRPSWMAGHLNAIGGKIEPEEEVVAAMAREFKEETDLLTLPEDWQMFDAEVFSGQGKEAVIYWFFNRNPINIRDYKTMTDEVVDVYPIEGVFTSQFMQMYNLKYLLEKALCFKQFKDVEMPLIFVPGVVKAGMPKIPRLIENIAG